MEMLKKDEVPEGFIDRLETLKMLDISKTHFTEIIPTLNIETLKIGHDCYYKLSDIEKFIEDFKDFYDNHIPFQDVVDRFGRACLDKNGKPCMFDTVSKKPFYNQGTGEFLYG